MKPYENILIMTAVAVEQEAVLRGLAGDKRFAVKLAGVGPIAAGVNTTKALADKPYDLVISAGIGGGFPTRAEIGTLVVASDIVAADLGVETLDGFQSVDELGFGSSRVPVATDAATRVTEALQAADLPVTYGPVLTLSTATGTAATTDDLQRRVPHAAAEAMEGYGVAFAAHESGVPVLEVRAISNAVGPRDRGAWRIKDALAALEAAAQVLTEVL
ncbi:MAG TPA: futalosine hydrolase [Bacilli bacterium]|nr:futalosine hydrolase [Bacilli bacterium]